MGVFQGWLISDAATQSNQESPHLLSAGQHRFCDGSLGAGGRGPPGVENTHSTLCLLLRGTVLGRRERFPLSWWKEVDHVFLRVEDITHLQAQRAFHSVVVDARFGSETQNAYLTPSIFGIGPA